LYVGSTYTFTIEARNEYGYSTPSSSIDIYCAFVPAQIQNVQTIEDGPDAQIQWDPTADNGAVITSYTILLKQRDGTFATSADCDGTDSTIISNRSCKVPLASIILEPFSLRGGDSLFAKVIATNSYGNSIESLAGNGCIVVLVPDAPLFLENQPDVTSATQVGLTWVDGLNDGGKPVLDYTIEHDQASGSWTTLEAGILTNTYVSTAALTSGATY
jgi:hypothetical protein